MYPTLIAVPNSNLNSKLFFFGGSGLLELLKPNTLQFVFLYKDLFTAPLEHMRRQP